MCKLVKILSHLFNLLISRIQMCFGWFLESDFDVIVMLIKFGTNLASTFNKFVIFLSNLHKTIAVM
jgi:hypothetical protein